VNEEQAQAGNGVSATERRGGKGVSAFHW